MTDQETIEAVARAMHSAIFIGSDIKFEDCGDYYKTSTRLKAKLVVGLMQNLKSLGWQPPQPKDS